MSAKTILKYLLTHCLILTFILFLTFSGEENGDINVVIFGTVLYFPFIIILTIMNILLIVVGLKTIKTKHFKWLTVFFSTAILTTCYLFNAEQMIIYNWKFTQTEFISLNIILCIINLATVYSMTKK